MKYKIKEIADITDVTIRTLYHYDKIGLLKPKSISEKGYRFYDDENIEKLQQILFFKEIGFSLEEIKNILDDKNFDRKKALEYHKEVLIKKRERIDEIIKTVENTIISIDGGKNMEKKSMFKGLSIAEIEEHKEKTTKEAKEKWGHTSAYQESERRSSNYSSEDWDRINKRAAKTYQIIIDNIDKSPSDPIIQEAVGELRQNITDNFYNCTPEIFAYLGETYVDDERFASFYEKMNKGMSVFLRDAIRFYSNQIK